MLINPTSEEQAVLDNIRKIILQECGDLDVVEIVVTREREEIIDRMVMATVHNIQIVVKEIPGCVDITNLSDLINSSTPPDWYACNIDFVKEGYRSLGLHL